MRIAAVMILSVLDLPWPARADCYGLHEPNVLEQRDAYARDCETIRSLISCGIKERDAVAIVLDRRAMEGYMAQFIARCATPSTKATAAPKKQPPPWLAEMNKTRNSQTGVEDGLLYCHNIVAGIEKPRASNHVRDCFAWYGEEIRKRL
jgi:hypothetical protein